MHDPIEHLMTHPDLSDEEKAALRRAIESDPAWATLLACRMRIADGVESAAEDRRRFALCALRRAGRVGDLTPSEAAEVEAHDAHFVAAIERHSSLRIAADDVGDAASEFEALWDDHFESESGRTTQGAADETARPAQQAAHPADHSAHPAEKAVRPAGSFRDRAAVRPRRRRAARWAVRSAIAIAVAAFAFILTQVVERDGDMITVQTAAGETRIVELGEGSQIRLLEGSTLSYADPQSKLIRSARLDGRAFFEIAPEGRGFIVETATARATVLGTAFAVDAGPEFTEVVLAEGSLTLARAGALEDLVVLEPGQMSRVAAGSSPTRPATIDLTNRLGWTGLFIFKSKPLGEIAELLSTYYDVPVAVNEALANERVTGTFEQSRPVREILDVIAAAVGATVAESASGGYVLTHL